MSVRRLEDVFAGRLELTASERALVFHALMEWYANGGGGVPAGMNRRDFIRTIVEKFKALRLEKMVTPDGSRLVSVGEHETIVRGIEPFDSVGPGSGDEDRAHAIDSPGKAGEP